MTKLYRCEIGPRSANALLALTDAEWKSIEFSAPIRRIGTLCVATDELRVLGNASFAISVQPVSLERKLEVFAIRVDTIAPSNQDTPSWQKRTYVDAGELLSAFVGPDRRLFVAGRLHSHPEFAANTLVEDVLVMRDGSGQQAYVVPDHEVPGRLLVARERSALPYSDMPFEYLRVIL